MKFFTNYKRISSIIPVLNTETEHTFVRDHLLRKPTRTEYLIASRIAKTIDSPSDDPTKNPLVRQQLRNKSKWINNLIIHYMHEARLAHLNGTRTLIRRRPHHHLPGTNIEHHTLHETEIAQDTIRVRP